MSTEFDRLTESDIEQTLMAAIRSGEVTKESLPARIPAFPLKIQVQTISPCNARCVMCPWPLTMNSQPQGRMSDAVFRAFADQIADRPVERLSLFLMNEPLLDRALEERCALVRERNPRARRVIFTNGQLLDAPRAMRLLEHGMNEIDISVIGFTRELYEANMRGLDYDRVMQNLRDLMRAQEAGRLDGLELKIVTLDLPGVSESAADYAKTTRIPVMIKPVTNRAGLIDVAALGRETAQGPVRVACQRPFVKAYVLYTGDLVLCNCDWERTEIIGNILETPLERLWHSDSLARIREAHRSGQLLEGSICSRCDYPWLI